MITDSALIKREYLLDIAGDMRCPRCGGMIDITAEEYNPRLLHQWYDVWCKKCLFMTKNGQILPAIVKTNVDEHAWFTQRREPKDDFSRMIHCYVDLTNKAMERGGIFYEEEEMQLPDA